MTAHDHDDDEEKQLRAVALKNAATVDIARQRAERHLADANEKLRARERELSLIYETVGDVIFSVSVEADGGFRFASANAAFMRTTGLAETSVVGRRLEDVVSEPARSRVLQRYREAVGTRQTVRWVEKADWPAGHRVGEVAVTPIFDDSGRCTSLIGTVHDVTERTHAEEMSERLAAVVSSSDDAIVSKTLEGVINSWNAGAERMFGYTAEEVVGRPITILIPEERAAEEPEILARIGRGERIDHYETVRVRKDGSRIDVSLTVSPVKSRDGRVIGVSKSARDVTERKRSERALAAQAHALLEAERAARNEAERVSQMKDEFLATLSHELRTPLNAIVGWAHLLRQRPGDRLDDGLAIIERNATAQAQLIDDLLDMSRIAAGKVRLDVQRVELGAVLEAAIESVRHSAEAKGIRLQTVLDPQTASVRGDPNRLQQCFWNLVSNAIKFTPKGGRVQVALARVNSHLEVSVTDDGQGISPEFLPHVFERFRQADASSTRAHGGLGLGLSIVKSLVELHGGSVRAESAGPGKGSTFTIEVPFLAVSGLLGDQPHEHPDGSSEPLAGGEFPSLEGLTVLTIDDEPDARELVRTVLVTCGARVLEATSAKEGLALVQEHLPDMILCDIGMPGEDGYALIRSVRALPPERGGRTPAAALTAFARSQDRTAALRAGFQTHVAKPVEPLELAAVVASLASRR